MLRAGKRYWAGLQGLPAEGTLASPGSRGAGEVPAGLREPVDSGKRLSPWSPPLPLEAGNGAAQASESW